MRRIHATASVAIPPVGDTPVFLSVFKVPPGFDFDARRVEFDIPSMDESSLSNALAIGLGGNSLAYYRSGTRLQWAMPRALPVSLPAIPGVETWSREQGPRLTGGEVFEIRLYVHSNNPFILGQMMVVSLEGELESPGRGKLLH